MTFLEVAVAAPINHTLTYAPPGDTTVTLQPGLRLLVPLGGRLVTGYLLEILSEAPAVQKIKPVAEVLDETPLFPESFVPFCRWIARYYQYPIGEVIKTALPGGLTRTSGHRIILTPEGHARLLADEVEIRQAEYPWLADLLARDMLTPAVTAGIWRNGKERRVLRQWESKGWIEIKNELVGGTVGVKTETCVELADSVYSEQITNQITTDADAILKPSEKKTLVLYEELAAANGNKPVPRRELAKIYPGARNALKSLEQKGIIRFREQRVYRDPFGELPSFFPPPEKLTDEQAAALDRLVPAVEQKKYRPFLLHGVTGSGKTEIYLQAAAACLAMQRGVLVLVPEIALTTQLEGHFLSRFGDAVALLHSGLSVGERFDQWQRILRGEALIVIGARSAVFAPLADPGLIIVDEEHEGAYKQEDGLRYQARDLAVLRASLANATVVLGSATPSVASYQHAQNGKYELLSLAYRVENRPLPEVKIVDLRTVKTVSGQPPFFSPELVVELRGALKNHEQSLVFLNRRGYANLMLCRQCGHTVQCRNCNVSLTLHMERRLLICHYCGHSQKSAAVCPNCGSGDMAGMGVGTERLESELRRLFPKAVIARLDRDTCTKRKDYLTVLKDMYQGKTDILLGTQMIAKGHHFPGVTLVGIVWADAGLGLPDFRAGERTFQLISQVSGRAGRGAKPGRVIVQTHTPDHYSVVMARDNDYSGFFEKEMGLRRTFGFPPCARLINLKIEGQEEGEVRKVAGLLAREGKKIAAGQHLVEILGPAPAPLAKIKGKHRWQVILKGENLESLHSLTGRLLRDSEKGLPRGVKVSADIDPENML